MNEIDNNSMKQKNMLCQYSIFGLRNTNRKSLHKYIVSKKGKTPIQIKSINFLFVFLVSMFTSYHLFSYCQIHNIALIFICMTNLVQLIPFTKYLDIYCNGHCTIFLLVIVIHYGIQHLSVFRFILKIYSMLYN